MALPIALRRTSPKSGNGAARACSGGRVRHPRRWTGTQRRRDRRKCFDWFVAL